MQETLRTSEFGLEFKRRHREWSWSSMATTRNHKLRQILGFKSFRKHLTSPCNSVSPSVSTFQDQQKTKNQKLWKLPQIWRSSILVLKKVVPPYTLPSILSSTRSSTRWSRSSKKKNRTWWISDAWALSYVWLRDKLSFQRLQVRTKGEFSSYRTWLWQYSNTFSS